MSNKYITEEQFERFINKVGEDIYNLSNRPTSSISLPEEFLNKMPRILRMLELLEKERDTDGDVLSDYDEFEVHKTNPDKKDTDDDGYSDGVETSTESDPKDSKITPPLIISRKIIGFDPSQTMLYYDNSEGTGEPYEVFAYRVVDEEGKTVDISNISFSVRIDGEEVYKQIPAEGVFPSTAYEFPELAPQATHLYIGGFNFHTDKVSFNLSLRLLETNTEISTTLVKESHAKTEIMYRAQGGGFIGTLTEKEMKRDNLKLNIEESNIYVWSSRYSQYVTFNIKTNDNFPYRLLIDDVVLEGQNYPLYDYPFTGKTLVVDFPDLGKKFNLRVLEASKESFGSSYTLTHKFEKILEEVY